MNRWNASLAQVFSRLSVYAAARLLAGLVITASRHH